jgi:acylphosphatase
MNVCIHATNVQNRLAKSTLMENMTPKTLTMNKLLIATLAILLVLGGSACSTNCQKKSLRPDQRAWVDPFKEGTEYLYVNYKGQIDTLGVMEVRNYYTPCDKVELSDFQFEEYDAAFVIKSASFYNNSTAYIGISASGDSTQAGPVIVFGNVGTYTATAKEPSVALIDTLLEGRYLSNVYFHAVVPDTGVHAEKQFFRNFFWSKDSGLVAYTTINEVVFHRAIAQEGIKMEVTGYAENRKGGGVVLSVIDSASYFVEGIDSWDEKMVGKKIKVTGTLHIQHFDPLKPGEEERQMIVGTVRTLLKPKWELVK